MTPDEGLQSDVQQAKDQVSELKADAERKVAEAAAIGFIAKEAAKDASEFNATNADLKARHEKLQAQRAQLRGEISTKIGEARAKLQADLDRVAAEIAKSDAAMDAYYARRDETGLV